MPSPQPIATTQRAYTLRLNGPDKADCSWRDALWATHEAVNRGAKAFGDWLLTLRGGLCHTLVTEPIPGGKGKPALAPTLSEQRDRRVLLALSWLSVESERGAPAAQYRVPGDADGKPQLRAALEAILAERGVAALEFPVWWEACQGSLGARIRDDAVWIDRSRLFDEKVRQIGPSLTRSEVWDLLGKFFGEPHAYFFLEPDPSDSDQQDDGGEDAPQAKEEAEKDLVQKAGQWLSARMGEGKGADFERMTKVYAAMNAWARQATPGQSGPQTLKELAQALAGFQPTSQDCAGLMSLISGPGYKSATRNLLEKLDGLPQVQDQELIKLAETAQADGKKSAAKTGGKGPRPWATAILEEVAGQLGFTYSGGEGQPARHKEYSVILDHAARRVVIGHSWIKRAETERRSFEKDKAKLAAVPEDAQRWLENHCRKRGEEGGALGEYRIRKRAVDGWKDVVGKWSTKSCATAADRIQAARDLQQDLEKFGDIQLFEALATDDAQCVWRPGGAADAAILLNYVAATTAADNQRRFKVPAYRHPDPLRHPVFCDFGNSRWHIGFQILDNAKVKKRQKKQAEPNPRGLTLKLWTGLGIQETPLLWQSKRFAADLSHPEEKDLQVTRADRLGRAAANAPGNAQVSILGLFEQKEWNGRLQVPRAHLDQLAWHLDKIAKKGKTWDHKASRLRDHLPWLISFSARLEPMGPWVDFAKRNGLLTDPKYAQHVQENKSRKGMAKLMLARLPGLRVVSVDLGHRYAAACAVWETISNEGLAHHCQATDNPSPQNNDLFYHLRFQGKTTIYRRIGPDILPDGKSHPAPWARLDRQFLIKLQGEDQPSRSATVEERLESEKLEKDLGLISQERKAKDWQVSNLMADCVRTVRLALRRHGDVARIAWGWTAKEKPLPGNRSRSFSQEELPEHLLNLLIMWSRLAHSPRSPDSWANEYWDRFIVGQLGGPAVEIAPEDETGPQRKSREDKERAALKAVADKLASLDRQKLHIEWAQRWREQDTQWPKRLRCLRRWIMPRGRKQPKETLRRVGGLSLDRLATLRLLYQVQKQFRMRPEPDDLRKNIPQLDDHSLDNFGLRILTALEKMRTQRVKQLASRIVEAALGIGSEDRKHWQDGRRPRQRIDDPRFAPCHAVVIENLTNYRPEDSRTRRENRQLMAWASGKVRKCLEEQCQLHGLHLREVSAGYTSRQDSRTGAPGMRCQDVAATEFMGATGRWRQEIQRAEKKIKEENKGDARDRLLVKLADRLRELPSEAWQGRIVRVPQRGGDLFVSADPASPAAHGLQADLNAAANIGLKALLDPDGPMAWWYVPCGPDQIPLEDKVKGSALFTVKAPLPTAKAPGPAEPTKPRRNKEAKEKKAVTNMWRDLSCAVPINGDNPWENYAAYQAKVACRVANYLCWKWPGNLLGNPAGVELESDIF